MRLSSEEVQVLKKALAELSPEAKLYLFGSRVDDRQRGGDIDLLVVDSKLKWRDLRKLRLAFFSRFGEQKLDVILDNGDFKDPFHRLIKQQAVLL